MHRVDVLTISKCDGVQPGCSQCVFRRIRCSGYKQQLVFVPNPAVTTRIKMKTMKKPKVSRLAVVEDTHTLHPNQSASPPDTMGSVSSTESGILETTQPCLHLEEDIHFIMQQYSPVRHKTAEEANLSLNQICGAWVTILGLIAGTRKSDYPLVPAIRTLATALRYYDGNREVSQPRILEMYGESLRHMSRAVAEARGAFHIEHCAAILCLADVDVCSHPTMISVASRLTAVCGDYNARVEVWLDDACQSCRRYDSKARA